jgi:hypothetical protein
MTVLTVAERPRTPHRGDDNAMAAVPGLSSPPIRRHKHGSRLVRSRTAYRIADFAPTSDTGPIAPVRAKCLPRTSYSAPDVTCMAGPNGS